MSRSINNQKHLERQVEQISDTADGDTYEVIVRMRRDDDDNSEFLRQAATLFRRRSLSISARDFLPEAQKKTVGRSGRRSSRSTSGARGLATASSDDLVPESPAVSAAALRALSLRALDPLLKSDAVVDARNAVSRAEGEKVDPLQLWTSSSAVIPVRQQDLRRIISSVGNIKDIYLNRRLFVPPVAVPKKVPEPVEDNKASSWGVRRIGALAAWGAYERRGEGVLVGLLDTGVDPSHPDLKGKIAHWAEFDALGRQVRSKPYDSDQHGTHCAGTIAGGNASSRWIGVAPDAKLAVGLVLDGRLGGTDAQILAGIDWAVGLGVDVISMSLGAFVLGPLTPNTYTKAIRSAMQVGIPVVTAIGNEGNQTSGAPGSDYFAFAVGATDHLDLAAGFSGGRTQIVQDSSFFPAEALPLLYSKPEVSAPGVAVYSSVPGRKWEHFNGTSMAAPHVAGAIALLLSATNIKQVPAHERAFLIQNLLIGSAEELGESGQNHRFGFGRIDVLRAIGFARELGY